MKKLVGSIGIIIMLLNLLLPVAGYAEFTGDENSIITMFSDLLQTMVDDTYEVGLEYTEGCYKGVTTENYGIKITEYTCSDKNITIPGSINGYNVKEIGENVFENKLIQSVVFPDSIELIGTGAFKNSNFNGDFILTFPDSLKRICSEAFEFTLLTGVVFNEGLEYIGDNSFRAGFYGNSKPNFLKTVIIPNSVKYIGQYAFHTNPIELLQFGSGLEYIGDYAFQSSYDTYAKYDKVVIPDSVKYIGYGAFQTNKNLHSVIIGSGSGEINIQSHAFDNCGVYDFIIDKETIIFNGNSMGYSPYENIVISGNMIQNGEGWLFTNSNYGGTDTVSLTFNTSGSLMDRQWDYQRIGSFNIGPRIDKINTKIVINYRGNVLRIPGNVKYIEGVGRSESMYENELILEEGIEEITGGAFRYNYNITGVIIPSSVKIIGTEAFSYDYNILSVVIPEGVEVLGEKAFSNTKFTSIKLPNSLKVIGDNAFCELNYNSQTQSFDKTVRAVTGYVTKDIPIERLNNSENSCINFVRLYVVDFTGAYSGKTEIPNQIISLNGKVSEPQVDSIPGYEFLGWYEENSEIPFNFEDTPITEDKTLFARWKALEEKVQELDTDNVTYTKGTTVTIGDEVQEEIINNSSIINIVSKEVEQHEVKEEENKTTVQETEIQVTSDKTVEYQGGLEVYLEKTENEETKRIEGTAKFSSPVAVKIPITSNTETVKVQVKHEGEDFGYIGLTLNPYNECVNGEAVNDKYNGENVGVIEINREKYALIYTCSASTFVAYTENAKPVAVTDSTSTSAAGGGRIISTTSRGQTINEPEHSSADVENKPVEQNITTQTKEIVIDSKLQQRSLTRGEVAVMTNILLDVFPELINGKQEIEDVTNACTNYADEQKFTKDEKKAITRLCKLSIMGIHADNNKPLDEFMVNERTKNDEFSKVINRSISTYNEKDFTVVKDALKKIETSEENVEFGTVYDIFMSIKNIFS